MGKDSAKKSASPGSGTRGVPDLRLSFGTPRIGTTAIWWLENSLGTPTAGVLLLGAQRASTRVFDGTVLVAPDLAATLQIAPSGQNVVLAIPNNPGLVRESIYLQAAELDVGASAGVSFTRGVELRIGG